MLNRPINPTDIPLLWARYYAQPWEFSDEIKTKQITATTKSDYVTVLINFHADGKTESIQLN